MAVKECGVFLYLKCHMEMCVMRGGGMCVCVIHPRSNHKLVMNVCLCLCVFETGLWVLLCRNGICMWENGWKYV